MNSLILAPVAFFSLLVGTRFMMTGELELIFGQELCMAGVLSVILLAQAPLVLLAIELRGRVATANGLRGIYGLVLLPVVLLSFMFASIADATYPSFVFASPLLFATVVALPFSANMVRLDIRGQMATGPRARVVCHACGGPLDMVRGEAMVNCARCGTLNVNPFAPDNPAPGGAPSGGPGGVS